MNWLFNLPPGAVLEHLLAFVGALVAAALATRVVMSLATRLDFVSRPRSGRHSGRVVPLGGGVGLFLTIAPGLALLSWDLLVAATLVFLLGLIDDRRSLSPPVKLVVQTVAACWLVAGPLDPGDPALLISGPQWLVLPLTVAWYVGMANSVNLLDNMDGSAAGVAAVAGGFIYILAVGGHAPDAGLAASTAVLVGAAVGFLIFNFPPARVFMGDAGSLLLGLTLAGLALRLPRGEGAATELAVAVFVLGIPLFDTALVWFSRRAARRPFLRGGTDHTTHRLLALGLSERRTVLVVYGVAALLGGIGIAVARGGVGTAVITAGAGGIVLVLLGVFLGEVPVYEGDPEEPPAAPRRSAAALYAVELLVDVAILSAAWIGAYAIRFEEEFLGYYLEESALPALPFVIAFKASALLFFRLYRGFWRTIRFGDVLDIAKALTLSSLLIVVTATVAFRFKDFSRGVFVIDWLLSFTAVLASRSALRFMRGLLSTLVGRPKRAALVGPSALEPLLDLSRERYELVATVDPGEPDAVVEALREQEVEVVLLAAPEDDPLAAAVRAAGIELRRLAVLPD